MKKTLLPCVWVMSTEYAPSIIGGLGTVATELTKALISAHVNMKIITRSESRSVQFTKNSNGAVLRVPTLSRFYDPVANLYKPNMIEQLTNRYFPRKPDVIHVHSLEFAQASLSLKHKYHIPVIYTCHSLISMEGGKRLRRSRIQDSLIRQADTIVVPSFWLKKEILKRYAGAASKVKVIPNGVRSVSNGTNVPPHRLLFVGRLVKDKGIEPLIRSISLLSAKNQQVRLTIIGKGSSKYRKQLGAVAKKKGVYSKIRWMGSLPHSRVQQLYSSYGAVVVPSKRESFCLVALEAMANGVPLVSSRAGGLREFVNQRNAQIITAVESTTIGHAVIDMWNHPGRTRQRVANAKLVAKRNHWFRMADRYKSLFMYQKTQNRRFERIVKAK